MMLLIVMFSLSRDAGTASAEGTLIAPKRWALLSRNHPCRRIEPKAWPVALASQLSSNSSNRSENPGWARGRGLLLPALLGMAAALAKGFPPGKRAFIFAGPEGKQKGGMLSEEGGGGVKKNACN